MKKTILIIGMILIVLALFSAGKFYFQNLRGARPAFGPIPTLVQPTTSSENRETSISETPVNSTGLPLTLPNGFSISTFVTNVSDARVLAWDSSDKLLVSSPDSGTVFAVSPNGDRSIVVSGLHQPHGLAFKDGKLYVAETDAVAVYEYDGKATNRKKIVDLPSGGNHFSRTIGFGPDGKLYVSIGSSCNVCVEKDARRASIWVANNDGSDFRVFASGLRNSVFFTWHPITRAMWATDMGRDLIGDNTPPEEVNIISEGKNYGWPYCYSKQVHDKQFDSSGKYIDFCKTTVAPVIEYQAHSAPLGLAFIPDSWGKDYAGDLLVAYHGSWNRSVPTGYKIVRFKLDDKGALVGAEDFISGWLTSSGAVGRPVDLLFDDKGVLYISDDKKGVIYRVIQT